MGDEIACCAPSITDLGSCRAQSSGSAGCASGSGTRTAVPACRAPMCAALGAGLAVSGVISERVQAERGCTANLTVVRDSHCNRGERANQYSRFALGDEEHREGQPAPTRSREGARVAGLGVLAGPELPHRSRCSTTAIFRTKLSLSRSSARPPVAHRREAPQHLDKRAHSPSSACHVEQSSPPLRWRLYTVK
jgi:hypothetical protein